MNKADDADQGAVVLEFELAQAPEKVWRALTERELLAAWLMPNDFRPELGAEFTFRPPPELALEAPIRCKVLALEPPALLRFSWRETDEADSGSLSFTLTRSAQGGTLLRLVHSAASPRAGFGQILRFPSRSSRAESLRCAA